MMTAMQLNAVQSTIRPAIESDADPSNVARLDAPLSSAAQRGAGRARIVRAWLWCVAALVFAMVLVGGATRLTQSGLSIVEWQPVTGVVPPLDAAGLFRFPRIPG